MATAKKAAPKTKTPVAKAKGKTMAAGATAAAKPTKKPMGGGKKPKGC